MNILSVGVGRSRIRNFVKGLVGVASFSLGGAE